MEHLRRNLQNKQHKSRNTTQHTHTKIHNRQRIQNSQSNKEIAVGTTTKGEGNKS